MLADAKLVDTGCPISIAACKAKTESQRVTWKLSEEGRERLLYGLAPDVALFRNTIIGVHNDRVRAVGARGGGGVMAGVRLTQQRKRIVGGGWRTRAGCSQEEAHEGRAYQSRQLHALAPQQWAERIIRDLRGKLAPSERRPG